MNRPDEMHGFTERVETPQGNAYITVNFKDKDSPAEIFIRVGKAGTAVQALSEVIGRLCSIALQHGTPPSLVCKQLRNVSHDRVNGNMLSIPSAVAEVLEEHAT